MLASFASGLKDAITFGTTEGLTGFTLAQFATNVTNAIFAMATTIALAALIWGGISYIISIGNETRVASAKRTIIYSILGLIIVGAASLIVGVILSLREEQSTGAARLANLIIDIVQLALIPAGAIAFGAIVYGGYLYIISAGDESKASTGKRVVVYAILGLIVIGLAGIIVNAVVNQIS